MTDQAPANPQPNGSIKGAARAIGAKASPKLKAAATSAHETYDHLKDAASETLGETRDRLQTAVSETTGQAQRRLGDVEAYVQLQPARALAIAAAAGLLVGLLLRGSSKTIYLRDAR